MKYALFLCGALALAASCAHAEYVCEVNLESPALNPTHGMYGDILLAASTQRKTPRKRVCKLHNLSQGTPCRG